MSTVIDLVDELVNTLNGIEGLAFVKDAWKNKAPENYGVVELTGQKDAVIADGHMIEQSFAARVTIYVSGGENTWLNAVQSKLEEADVPYRFPEREYLYDIGKVSWAWDVTLYGQLTRVVDDGTDGS